MSVSEFAPFVTLFGVGVAAGVINMVAGGGSFLTLPILMFLGMPAAVANGTNRVGLLAQSVAGVWGFPRSSAMGWSWALRASVPTIIGSLLGAWYALQMTDFTFKRLLSVAMLGMTLWTVLRPPRVAGVGAPLAPWHPGMVVAFFLIGLYGGVIQAGVGFGILAATSVAGMDLVKGTSVKLVAVLLLTALSLAVFASGGAVWWGHGIALGTGNALGALVGVKIAVRLGHRRIQRAVAAAVVGVAVLLWLDS